MISSNNFSRLSEKITDSFLPKNDDINTLLNTGITFDILDALFTIFENMGQCIDTSCYLPQIIKLIASENIEIKRLVCIFVAQYCSKNPEITLLCISTLQKGLKFSNHLIRGLCMRTLIHLNSNLFSPVQHRAIADSISDSSSYFRKISCLGIITLLKNHTEYTSAQCFELLSEFLSSESDIVFGNALIVLYFYFIENIDILHKHFFRLCNSLRRLDELYLPFAVELLILYSRTYFCDQRIIETSNENIENQKYMAKDFEFLLYSCLPLLSHRSSAVVMSIIRLIYYCAPENFHSLILEPILLILTTRPFLNAVLTYNIEALILIKPDLFMNYLSVFYVKISDDINTKKKKTDILVSLINSENWKYILAEFSIYSTYPQFEFAAYSIRKLTECALKEPKTVSYILDLLVKILKSNRSVIVAEVVIVLRTLLQINVHNVENKNQFDLSSIIQRLIILFDNVSEPVARESIVWLVSEYCRELPHLAPDMLRLAARSFCNDITNVKHQTLNLAARLVAINDSETVHALADYVFNLAKYDQNHDIRDRHRFLVNILEFQKSEKIDKNLIKRVLFSPKPVPNVSYENIENTQTQEIMTLSFFLNREITGYRNIPEYSNVEIDPSVRIVMKETLNEKYEISSEKSESSYYSEEEEDSENEDKDTETEPETEEEEEEEELRYN